MDRDIYGLDFETTDVDAKICEAVEMALIQFGGPFDYRTLIKPVKPIPPEVSAIHHIIDEDVANAPSWQEVKNYAADTLRAAEGAPLPVVVAHNCEYERNVLGEFVPVLWICTYKCALRVWPDAPNHKNETLRYWLKLGDTRGRQGSQGSHSAAHDTLVTLDIFAALLQHATVDQMIEWTEQPTQLPYMPFGKHFKKKWEEIDSGYLTWIKNQGPDMREDVRNCAIAELRRRGVRV